MGGLEPKVGEMMVVDGYFNEKRWLWIKLSADFLHQKVGIYLRSLM
jgi:hypothetical protein